MHSTKFYNSNFRTLTNHFNLKLFLKKYATYALLKRIIGNPHISLTNKMGDFFYA